MADPLFLGVDGGGSRCRARLETADGGVLGEGLAGPASMRFGFEAARASILRATHEALRQAGLGEDALARTYAGIGLAGTGQPGARAALEAWRHPFAGAWFEGDGYLALLGAFGGEDGGVVIVGTGSIAITHQHKTVRIGGYGFPVSDEGSGADLGLNAVRFALRTLDGRAEPSAFSREVLARFSSDTGIVAAWIEQASATDYAALAPIVVKQAEAGDAVARSIMREAGARIGELVEALFRKGAPRVALSGGLAPAITLYMSRRIVARLTAPQKDALSGGVLLAKRRLGWVAPGGQNAAS